MNEQNHDIIVIGGSAGSFEALPTLLAPLEPDLPAAVFIVQHMSPDVPPLMAQRLSQAGRLPVSFAEHDESIQTGHIYVAPPDHHMLLKPELIQVVHGPRENRTRPAIDPLFRSAAVNFGARVIGVILTGMLDDGTAGLIAVKRCGGLAIVQDPEDAVYPSMPQSALDHVAVDYCLPLSDLGMWLNRLAVTPVGAWIDPPEDLILENRLTERAMSGEPLADRADPPSPLNCPECGGPMWNTGNDDLRRYRCHVGHGFTLRALLAEQEHAVEQSLWVALRTLQERARVLGNLATEEHAKGRTNIASVFVERAAESTTHAERIKKLLLQTEKTLSTV